MIFNRFGPYDLFKGSSPNLNEVLSVLKQLQKESSCHGARAWKIFAENYTDIVKITKWVVKNITSIAEVFPRSKNGEIPKNRYLLIREYAPNVSPSGQSLSSSGFEGTNYRIVLASDSDRQFVFRIGEYLNLSGTLLHYRKGYPKSSTCDVCKEHKPVGICTVCGRSYCRDCSALCGPCETRFCSICYQKQGCLKYSAHEWYFHRIKKA